MSCLSVKISKKNEHLQANTRLLTPPFAQKITITKICSLGIAPDGTELFLVSDGVFLLADGKKFNVLIK